MTFDAGSSINNIVDYICESKFTHYIITNPIIVALLLTCIIVTIILGTFYSSIKSESWTSFVRVYIYSAIVAVIITLFHYRCQEREIEKRYSNEQGKQLFDAVEEARTVGGTIKNNLTEPDCGCDGKKEENKENKENTEELREEIKEEMKEDKKEQSLIESIKQEQPKPVISAPVIQKRINNPGLILKMQSPQTKSPFRK